MSRKPPEKRYLPICTIRLIRENTLVCDRKTIKTPEDAHRILEGYFADLSCEHFTALLLSTKNHVVAVTTVSIGSLNSSIVHPRELFQRAILANAASLILAHNHPSGDPTPSPEDLELTKRLAEAGKLLDIPVLDHLVVGEKSFVSLKERGCL